MLQFKTATTCTITKSPEPVRRGNIRRVRLTLHAEGNSTSARDETKSKGKTEMEEKTNAGHHRKRNGFTHPESNRTEPPVLHLSNGMGSEASPQGTIYGVVQRADDNKAEVVVYEWSVNQLKEEMNYITEMRHSLEKVRQQMFGEFSGMKERMKQLTNEMRVSEARQESLQREVKSNSSTLEQYSQMNSSLTTLTIDLQKSLLDSTAEANKRREEMEVLRNSYHQSLEQMKEKNQQIHDAQTENQILKLKIEASQEANTSAMQDMTRKLYNQYEAKLKEAKQLHQAEKEAIQARINQALKELEEANKKALAAEQKIAERDQRIQELDQLIARMVEERHLLQQRLQEQEKKLSQRDETDSRNSEWSQKVEEKAASLRERIRHLDNMVHCQQRKVKQMIEEIEILKSKIQQKDVMIEDLLERISFLEAENKELQDKLNYMMSLDQQRTVETREQVVSYDSPIRITPVKSIQNTITPYMRLMELSLQRQTPSEIKKDESEASSDIVTHGSVRTQDPDETDNPAARDFIDSTLQKLMPASQRRKELDPTKPLMRMRRRRESRPFLSSCSSPGIMSTGPTDRQGIVGDLHKKSRGELVELLRRQMKLLANTKFIQSLPDKGKRITEFIQKLEAAIAQHEEVERATELLSVVKLEFQKKQRERSSDEEILHNENATSILTTGQVIRNILKDCDEAEKDRYVLSKFDGEETINKESSKVCIKNQELRHEKHRILEKEQATSGSSTDTSATKSENSFDSGLESQRTIDLKQEKTNHIHPHNIANDLEADFVSRTDLLSDRLDKVTLTDNGHRKVHHKIHEEPTLSSNVKFNDNPFQTLHYQVKKIPHYIDILEQRAKNPMVKRAPFKANHPISGSSHSSPDQSPGRSALKPSPAERKLRDRKHLDEITAARLPPLYHSPAQLLSLEESGELQISQKQKYESTQARLAAEKLTQRLNIKIMNFNPEGAVAQTYREYRDRGDSSSSEEDLI
ncbi:myosin heavy chain, striated muscle-like [Heptranchias perlo]|uniref:myosin heavy chain, striated muscle-like n=1 Tax=Heptranchias perlo TaxID=212740 RepID=UPI003559ADB5